MGSRRKPFILEGVDEKGVLELLRVTRDLDKEFVEIGNRLVAGAGDYLRQPHLYSLIRDDLPFEVARVEIQREKAFVRRLVKLLPDLLRHFTFESGGELLHAITVIDRCCEHFVEMKLAPRRDRALREALSTLKRADRLLGQAIVVLAALAEPSYVGDDIDQYLRDYVERYEPEFRYQDYYAFLNQMELRHDAMKICLLKASTDAGYLFVLDNRGKNFIVEMAYFFVDYIQRSASEDRAENCFRRYLQFGLRNCIRKSRAKPCRRNQPVCAKSTAPRG
jgi:hypothetical protein